MEQEASANGSGDSSTDQYESALEREREREIEREREGRLNPGETQNTDERQGEWMIKGEPGREGNQNES